jgi:hypothetical protein
MATAAGLLVAALFVLTLPDDVLLKDGALKGSEVHLASAGIIGTALALVLSLSIIPAQKAADVFSAAILKLYARDRTTLWVFSLLSCAALLSLLLGTGWSFSISARYSLAAQFVLLGASLDALRAFYTRALDLLVPATALGIVSRECQHYIKRTRSHIERLLRIHRIAHQRENNIASVRYRLYKRSSLSSALTSWTTELEEFAHKGVARRDTQAVGAIMTTMAAIGKSYAEARSDSLILQTDFSGGVPIGQSDIGDVLNPIYESIKNICDDAAKQPSEAIVRGCLLTLGDMAAHAMTMIHTADKYRTAPLAHSPVFYIGVCVNTAIVAGMEDALLAAIASAQKVFDQISDRTDSRSAEATTLDFLFSIAVASYARQAIVSCFQSVRMMLSAAKRDIQVRGYRDVEAVFSDVLQKITALMPFETAAAKAGKRVMQTFPPYDMSFPGYIAALLAEVASQVKPIDPERSWIDPYYDFNEASEAVLTHYRNIAEGVLFEDVLLHKWVVETIFKCVEVHMSLMDNVPEGAEGSLESIEDKLRSFIYVHELIFREKKGFQYHHASDACGNLAVLGIALLQRQRLQLAEVCGEVINAIGQGAVAAENQNDYRTWGFADCMVKLEILARAADVLGHTLIGTGYRAHYSRPPTIPEKDWPGYAEAFKNRTRNMERELGERQRPMEFRVNPVSVLRQLLMERRG